MSLPWEAVGLGVSSSNETILKLERGVEPGWVEIIPLNRVTFHVLMMEDLSFEFRNHRKHDKYLTWLYSEQTDTRYFSLSVTLVTGDLCTVKVWNSWGP